MFTQRKRFNKLKFLILLKVVAPPLREQQQGYIGTYYFVPSSNKSNFI